MVKGKKKIELTKEAILSKISTFDIYRFYHGNFKINDVTVNRHRGEKNPSLIIGNKLTSELTHKDFGNYNWRGDAFHFVEQIHKCDFYEALQRIDRDMNLGISSTPIKGRKVVTWEQPEEITKKPPFFQIVTLNTLTKEGWDYWGKYYQGEEDIKRENIFMPKEIWRNKKKIYLGNLLTFCFYYPDIDKWKIYRPFAPTKEKDTPIHKWKWDTCIPFDYVENLENMENCSSNGFLAKSKKDRMVLMKALDTQCVASIQAEDPACVSPRCIEIFQNIEKKYAIMDNDKKGVETSWWLTKQHNFKHINVPYKYLIETPKSTDFADLAYNYDLEKVRNHFKNKNICV
jgi:hypothetical protein